MYSSGVAKPGPTRALARAILGRARANIFIILKIWTRVWAKPPTICHAYKFSYLACKRPLGARAIGQPWLRHWCTVHIKSASPTHSSASLIGRATESNTNNYIPCLLFTKVALRLNFLLQNDTELWLQVFAKTRGNGTTQTHTIPDLNEAIKILFQKTTPLILTIQSTCN